MNIRIRYFALLREKLKLDTEVLELAEPCTVKDALDAICTRHPEVLDLRKYLKCARNQEMAADSEPLSDNDELALIPPVAGGSDSQQAANHGRHAKMVEKPSLDACVNAVKGPGFGGLVTFTGMVRDHSQGKSVSKLEYEAYTEMAEKVFRNLCGSIESEVKGSRLAVEHATGTLAVGDIAVTIAAAAPHRAEAFAACRLMIDRLKESAPIWKKETSPDGSSWVGMGP